MEDKPLEKELLWQLNILERIVDGIAERRLRLMLNALVVTMRNILKCYKEPV